MAANLPGQSEPGYSLLAWPVTLKLIENDGFLGDSYATSLPQQRLI